MDIFDYSSYKNYVTERVASMPRKGHGQFRKIAQHLGVSSVLITQVLKGSRYFSEEHGLRLANYLGLKDLELEYFMHLILLEKAGTHELKTYRKQSLETLRKKAREVRNRIGKFQELDDTNKSVFYSDWTYSAIRLLTSVPEYRTIDALAERLEVSRSRVSEIMDFLLQIGLCKKTVRGFEFGPTSVYADPESRFTNNHRRNWRLKGLEGLNNITPDELFFSAPCTLSKTDFAAFKAELTEVVSKLMKLVPKTEPESLVCLNIDWFRV
jgi:uncharacterized protein (TIGR02147 family)